MKYYKERRRPSSIKFVAPNEFYQALMNDEVNIESLANRTGWFINVKVWLKKICKSFIRN
jgi:hypothetical protein